MDGMRNFTLLGKGKKCHLILTASIWLMPCKRCGWVNSTNQRPFPV